MPLKLPVTLEALIWVLRHDRLAQGICAAVVLVGSMQLAGWIGYIPFLFPALAMVAFVKGAKELESKAERSFWRALALAQAMLLVSDLVAVVDGGAGSLTAGFLRQTLAAGCGVLIVGAVERDPHQPRDLERGLAQLLTWPAAMIFVCGLMVYFRLLPWYQGKEEAGGSIFGLVLGIYLISRLLLLAISVRAPRWRSAYTLLASPMLFFMAGHLIILAAMHRFGAEESAVWVGPLIWELGLAGLALAGRIPHYGFPTGGPRMRESEHLTEGFRLSVRTLIFALLFPILHVLCYRFDHLDPGLRASREILVMICLALLGAMAFLQHMVLERRAERLWRERLALEDELRTSHQDLRLIVEHNAADELQRVADERFDLAFDACPYALALHSRLDGRLLEVNGAGQRLLGRSRDELVGKDGVELGLWNRRDAVRLRRLLVERNEAGEQRLTLRTASGEHRVLVSAAPLELHGAPLVMTIARPEPKPRHGSPQARRHAACFDTSHAAFLVVGAEGEVRMANRAAEKLFGWEAGEGGGSRIVEMGQGGLAEVLERSDDRAVWHGWVELGDKDSGKRELWVVRSGEVTWWVFDHAQGVSC